MVSEFYVNKVIKSKNKRLKNLKEKGLECFIEPRWAL